MPTSLLLSGLLLEFEALAVDGAEFGPECGHVDGVCGLGVVRVDLVPPRSGFGEACRAAGGWVGGHRHERSGGLFGWPAAAADGEVQGCEQVRGRPPGQWLAGAAPGLADLGGVVVLAALAVDAAHSEQFGVPCLPMLAAVAVLRSFHTSDTLTPRVPALRAGRDGRRLYRLVRIRVVANARRVRFHIGTSNDNLDTEPRHRRCCSARLGAETCQSQREAGQRADTECTQH